MLKRGNLYTSSLTDVENTNTDNVYLITRSDRNKVYAMNKGWTYVPELSPSWELFNAVKDYKEKGDWNELKFKTFYKPTFIRQLRNPQSVEALNTIVTKLNNGGNVTIVCYCHNEEMCHRSLIANILNRAKDV